MDIGITAEWAKKTANEIHGAKVEAQLTKCGVDIRNAVSQNKFETNVSVYADPLTIKELESRGFVVKQTDDQRDGSYLEISWK